jgi:transketolase
MVRVGIRDRFGESGKPDELLKELGLTASDIVKAIELARHRRNRFFAK